MTGPARVLLVARPADEPLLLAAAGIGEGCWCRDDGGLRLEQATGFAAAAAAMHTAGPGLPWIASVAAADPDDDDELWVHDPGQPGPDPATGCLRGNGWKGRPVPGRGDLGPDGGLLPGPAALRRAHDRVRDALAGLDGLDEAARRVLLRERDQAATRRAQAIRFERSEGPGMSWTGRGTDGRQLVWASCGECSWRDGQVRTPDLDRAVSRHRAEHRRHWQNCPEAALPAGFWAGVPRPRDAEGRPVGEGDTLIQVAAAGDLPAATMGLRWTVQRRTARRVQVVPAGWPPDAAPGVSRRRRSCPADALRAARATAGIVWR